MQEVPEKSIFQFLSCTWRKGEESKQTLLIDAMMVLTEVGGVRALPVFFLLPTGCQDGLKHLERLYVCLLIMEKEDMKHWLIGAIATQ